MAKVMVSLPDDLLPRLDEQARRRGTTRSGLLRELVERDLEDDRDARQRQIDTFLSRARSHDGKAVEHIRALRRSR